MLKEFRDFIMRGNVVELAVAVIIGAAFGAVITAFTTSFVTPLIAFIGRTTKKKTTAAMIRNEISALRNCP